MLKWRIQNENSCILILGTTKSLCSLLMLYIGPSSSLSCHQTPFYLRCMRLKMPSARSDAIFEILISELLFGVCLQVCLSAFHLNTLRWSYISYCTLTLPTKYAPYRQRRTAMLINIGCCLSNFQVARPHAVCRIKENIHLKVDFFFFWRTVWGGETEGCLLVQTRLERDVVALEARIVRQSSEAAPKGGPEYREYWVQREKTTGLACSVQMGQYDDDEKCYSKLIRRHIICQQAFPSFVNTKAGTQRRNGSF